MKPIESPRFRINTVFGLLLFISLMLYSYGSFSQTTTNFTGVWIQDESKSDDFYKSFEVEYAITQTPTKFSVIQTFTFKESKEVVNNEYTYTLDGKVTNWNKETGTEKNSAQWSADKQILTTKSTITYGNEDVGFTETYSLSGNNLILTVVKSNIIPDLPSVKLVFNKK